MESSRQGATHRSDVVAMVTRTPRGGEGGAREEIGKGRRGGREGRRLEGSWGEETERERGEAQGRPGNQDQFDPSAQKLDPNFRQGAAAGSLVLLL